MQDVKCGSPTDDGARQIFFGLGRHKLLPSRFVGFATLSVDGSVDTKAGKGALLVSSHLSGNSTTSVGGVGHMLST